MRVLCSVEFRKSYFSISYPFLLTCSVCRPRPTVNVGPMWKVRICPLPPLYSGAGVFLRKPYSLNFPNLCDNFVQKLVSEIRKCRQLQRDFVPLTPDQGFAPGSHTPITFGSTSWGYGSASVHYYATTSIHQSHFYLSKNYSHQSIQFLFIKNYFCQTTQELENLQN